jgi:hypothetical protein
VRPQGFRLKARGGKLEVNDRLEDDVVLWSDTQLRAASNRRQIEGHANQLAVDLDRRSAGLEEAVFQTRRRHQPA